MKKLRAGVAGVGFIGAAHVEAVRRLGFAEVVAICDRPRPEQIAEKLGVEHWYADYREMLDRERLDVVHICTPNVSHFEIARYAMERGVSVLCEKPLAFTLEEAEELVRLAERHGVRHGVNFHCRYYPMVREMRDTLPELVRSRSFLPEYRRRSILLGRPVRVLPVGQESYEATAESIDEEAALVVDCQGRKIRLQTGEVSIRVFE